jgi:transposase, IS5 family
MRPKQPKRADHNDLFKARLDQIINMKHELVALADKIDWTWLDEQIAPYFSHEGRPGEPVRFMLSLPMQFSPKVPFEYSPLMSAETPR